MANTCVLNRESVNYCDACDSVTRHHGDDCIACVDISPRPAPVLPRDDGLGLGLYKGKRRQRVDRWAAAKLGIWLACIAFWGLFAAFIVGVCRS